jgi:pimeloyl-ACP methyl ester carboxylesterase
MSFADSGGVRLYFDEAGAGETIVFAHELHSDYRGWEAQMRWFSRNYRSIAYNARGYPPSDVPDDPGAFGMPFVVDDLAAVLQSAGVERAHVVGCSMGAYAALHFGLRYPEMARSLVVTSVGSGSPAADRAAWIAECEATAKVYMEQGAAAAADIVAQNPARQQLRRKDPRGFEEFLAHLRENSRAGKARTILGYQARRPSLQDFEPEFSKMRIPVLLIAGDEDQPCLETTLWLKKMLPLAGLWVSPNTGHPVNLEEPAAFNRALGDFFAAVEHGRWK